MKVLVIGGSGVIGFKFLKYLVKNNFETFFTTFRNECAFGSIKRFNLDICNKNEVESLIKKIIPDIIVHTAASTNLDIIETNREYDKKTNIDGTRNIVDACQKTGSKIIFFSSAAVFDGTKKIYVENDKTNPLNYYGYTKVEGERLVMESRLPFLIFRTDQPYCWTEPWQKKNIVINILEKLSFNEPIRELVDRFNNPTFVDNMIEVSIKLIEKERNGVYHIIGPDYISRYDISLAIADIFKKDKSLISKIETKDLNIAAKRANVNLNNSKAEKDSGIKLVGLREGLNMMRETLSL